MRSMRKTLTFSIIIYGLTAILSQLVFIREFLKIFYGNEIVLGILMASWLFLTGIGAALGKKANKIRRASAILTVAHFIMSILPLITVYIIRTKLRAYFSPGIMPGIAEPVLTSLIVLLPFCIISGYLFSLYSYNMQEKENAIGKVYLLETLGSMAGGIIFSFIFIGYLGIYEALLSIFAINILCVIILSISINIRLLFAAIPLLLITSYLVAEYDFEYKTNKYIYKNSELLEQRDTPYGHLAVTKSEEQINFFSDGRALFSTGNEIRAEETVHYIMLQHPAPKSILLISGGVSGICKEILKYNPDEFDYVEIDPELIELGKKYTGNLNSDKINIINSDPALFLRETANKYDIIIINLPSPNSAGLNRFYTEEFYQLIKSKLKPGAYFSFSLPSTENYIGTEALEINATQYGILNNLYKNVKIFPGANNYFVASDSTIGYKFVERLEGRQFENIYFNKYYLDEQSIETRSNELISTLETGIGNYRANTDFRPLSYYLQFKYWLSYYDINNLWFILIFIIPLLWIVFKLRPVSLGLFVGGFSAIGSEFLLIISLQIIYGYIYTIIGLMFAAFMGGMALGAYLVSKKIIFAGGSGIKKFIMAQSLIGLYSFIAPFAIVALTDSAGGLIITASFGVLALIISILVGAQFAIGSALGHSSSSHRASEAYSADMFGSSIGALLVSSLLFPLFGLHLSFLTIAGLNFVLIPVIYLRRELA